MSRALRHIHSMPSKKTIEQGFSDIKEKNDLRWAHSRIEKMKRRRCLLAAMNLNQLANYLWEDEAPSFLFVRVAFCSLHFYRNHPLFMEQNGFQTNV
ncbi:hypothetical protein [Parageobacillus thermoglucosidasius]|uniref:Transposase DDE domain-containing protein n=1 Tax=Parageobacillus thermoglucosidasius TaxID=1426 RepID=A0A1B7KU65_PARTM|nr:hypothetical protein [Parageobacillus thermoglucosidasius]OAT73611.1 hypothetical protein A7K69_06465 [Parageobacillus thermoglucosidasius]